MWEILSVLLPVFVASLALVCTVALMRHIVGSRDVARWHDQMRRIAEAEEQLWTELDRRQHRERINREHQREPKP